MGLIFAKSNATLCNLCGKQKAWWCLTSVSRPASIATSGGGGLLHADDLEESEQLYREVLAGRIEALGDDDGATMASRYGLARCLSEQKRYSQAIELRRLELAWCRQQKGVTDHDTLTSMNGLAIDLRETGALEEAEGLFRELLEARQQVLEPSELDIGRALGGLSKILEEAGNLEDVKRH